MAVKCDIVSSQVVRGRTAYTISVKREDQARSLVRRHYTDFLVLDSEEPVRCLSPGSKPSLPPKGMLGLRHRLNLGSFNERRLEGLRQYLKQLLHTEAAESSAVERFLTDDGASALDKSLLPEDVVLTGSTATPRSLCEEDAAEPVASGAPGCGEDAVQRPVAERDYRLLPSTGTWLLRLPERAGSSSSSPSRPVEADGAQIGAELPKRSYRLLPSTGTWLLRLPERQATAGMVDAAAPSDPQDVPRPSELEPVRSYRLLPSTGTWLLRLPERRPIGSSEPAKGTAAREADDADAAAMLVQDTVLAVSPDVEMPADAAHAAHAAAAEPSKRKAKSKASDRAQCRACCGPVAGTPAIFGVLSSLIGSLGFESG